MSLVVLDTDVASAILRGRLPDRLRARLTGKTLCITFVTLGELTKWTALRSWGPRKLADLAQWRSGIVLLPFDEAVAVTLGATPGAVLAGAAPAGANDSWIAACCLVDRLPLATFNGKDYANFAEYVALHLFDVS